MPEPEPTWVKTDWKVEQLDNQLIEFWLPLKDGGIACGIGPLQARVRSTDNLLSIQISTVEPTGIGPEKRQVVLLLPQKAVDRIELHPNQEIARFRLSIGVIRRTS